MSPFGMLTGLSIALAFSSMACQGFHVPRPSSPRQQPPWTTVAASTSIPVATTTTAAELLLEQLEDKNKPDAFARSRLLGKNLFSRVISPVGKALVREGRVPTDWNDFWNLPAGDNANLTLSEQIVLALEEMGPTYVKIGQALSSRPDIVPRSLAMALATLQDQMQPFDTTTAKSILRNELQEVFSNDIEMESFVGSLSPVPVAAASIGQVYKGQLITDTINQTVAIKVQRPGIRSIVQDDATLLRTVVDWIENIPAIPKLQHDQQSRLIETDLSGAVEEFMSRVMEELDYRNEADNIGKFFRLYSHRRPGLNASNAVDQSSIAVVVPEVYLDFCTDNVLVMEWIDGTKLVDLNSESSTRESLALIEQGIGCTLSQLLDTGLLHADPHGGNLLKVLDTATAESTDPTYRLGYVDFGLLSWVPVTVRDGLVCAVAELVFANNASAVANLFGELSLIPDEILKDPIEAGALAAELKAALSQVLLYPQTTSEKTTSTIPTLRFDKLLDVLSRLVPRFRFQLPPYFLNNARALSTLEGMAREIDPEFNVLRSLYPYALKRILSNPNESAVVERTLQNLIRNPITGNVDPQKAQKLLNDSTELTGFSKRRILKDILKSRSGPRLVRVILWEGAMGWVGRWGTRLEKLSSYHRL